MLRHQIEVVHESNIIFEESGEEVAKRKQNVVASFR